MKDNAEVTRNGFYRFSLYLLIFLVSLFFIFVACEKDEPEPQKDPDTDYMFYEDGKGIVGKKGGQVTFISEIDEFDGAYVKIPENAINNKTTIEIIPVTNSISFEGDSNIFVLDYKPDGFQFNQPIEIGMPVQVNDSQLKIYYFDDKELVWKPLLNQTFNQNSKFIKAQTDHFTYHTVKKTDITFNLNLYKHGDRIAASVQMVTPLSYIKTNHIGLFSYGSPNIYTLIQRYPHTVQARYDVVLKKKTLFGGKTVDYQRYTYYTSTIQGSKRQVVVKDYDDQPLYVTELLNEESAINAYRGDEKIYFRFNDYVPVENEEYYIESKLYFHDENDFSLAANKMFTSQGFYTSNIDYAKKFKNLSEANDKDQDLIDDKFDKIIGSSPSIKIISPTNESQFTSDDLIEFEAEVSDPDDQNIPNQMIKWTSDKDGAIGVGKKININSLSINSHLIKAIVTDSDENTEFDKIRIEVKQGITRANVSTSSAYSITETSAKVGGKIVYNGGTSITERGVYWGTSSKPEETGTKKIISGTTDSFESELTGLKPGITYFFKAYAINTVGVALGIERSFKTKDAVGLPVITTSNPSQINENSARVGGNITSDGGAAITERGVYWGTSSKPEETGIKKIIASSTNIFEGELTGLNPNTTYYVKAYAINSKGISISNNEISFTTATNASVPVVETDDPSNITKISALVGGTIIDGGGSPTIGKGVYWSSSADAINTGQKLSISNGITSFSTTLAGLTPSTNYYVVAYVENSAGIGYGSEKPFTTLLDGNTGETGTVTDIDNNTYNTVTIGTQEWMAENLKVTKYPNGTAIPLVTDNSAWGSLGNNNTDDAYCFYNNESTSQYGALYTYAAAKDGPTGWHLPSDAEWTILENYLADNGFNFDGTIGGGGDKIAKALAATTNWSRSGNTGAVGNDLPLNNSSTFSALPGGLRNSSAGALLSAGYVGYWWSSTEYSSSDVYLRYLFYKYADVTRDEYTKSSGFSARCVRD